MKVNVTIKLYSYWQAGSGQGRGAQVDDLAVKDEHGLPYLPGRTVKGLLRKGAETAEAFGGIRKGTASKLFGEPDNSIGGQSQGYLRFQDAVLEDELRNWLVSQTRFHRDQLFDQFAQTALEEGAMAKDDTLRVTEVCVPLTLRTTVEGPKINNEDPECGDWREGLKFAAKLVRRLGKARHRGLGRCEFTMVTGAKTSSEKETANA